MKKVIKILLICLIIAGIIVISTIGFNVGTKYSENTQININIGTEFQVEDIRKITNEVFKNTPVLIQQVELYKDMVQITVKTVTDEQIETLNNKINEKYGIQNEQSDVIISYNSNVKLRSIVKPYILPITIVSTITIIFAMIVYRKLGIWKVLYEIAISIVAPQAILASFYAVTRLPINKIAVVISIIIYIASITLPMVHFAKLNVEKENKNIEKE